MLSEDPEEIESPIALVVDRGAIALPICRIAPGGEALVYTARLSVPMRVRWAPEVNDEWWMVRPDAYRSYVREVGVELGARGVTIERRVQP